MKFQHFYRAVDALTALVPAAQLIKEPAAMAIHHAESFAVLGKANESGFHWEDDVVTKHFLDIDLVALRKACVGH